LRCSSEQDPGAVALGDHCSNLLKNGLRLKSVATAVELSETKVVTFARTPKKILGVVLEGVVILSDDAGHLYGTYFGSDPSLLSRQAPRRSLNRWATANPGCCHGRCTIWEKLERSTRATLVWRMSVKSLRNLLKFELVGVVVNQWPVLESSGPQVGRLGGDGDAGHTTE